MPSVLQRTIPVLRMFDASKAREFYIDYLGFKVEFEARFHDNAPPSWAFRAMVSCST
jgi:hypothetical protein